MMGVPLQCSAILVRERVSLCCLRHILPVYFPDNSSDYTLLQSWLCPLQGLLQGCNSMCAGYLFQPDKQYDITYDTGDKAIQCGRHVDIFKFWLMWKAKVCVLTLSSISSSPFLQIIAHLKCESNNFLNLFKGNSWIRTAYWQVPGSISLPLQ